MNLLSIFRIFLLGLALGVSGCATSDPALWPPTPGSPKKEIYVSLDTWHAMIGFGVGDFQDQEHLDKELQAQSTLPSSSMFEEWGYAEEAWYLEGKQGITGALRALFWPSEGVVEVANYDQLWASRTPQPPSDLFKFELSEEGYKRLRTHLQSTKESLKAIKTFKRSRFYPATDSYQVFHHCHQYVARALQQAGLPVSTFWAITRSSLAIQLRRAQKSADEKEEG